ncbi:MAG: putative Type secretion system protein [Candidatus Saccharibacteria bacterium]|nr:putative Type secretion system protein [Candidatus Saccharibacteria bacterium]
MRRGFTIVEIIIIIAVMGILLVLGIVTLSDTQVKARDSERIADVQAISNSLDVYYDSGGNEGTTTTGKYPPTSFISQGDAYILQVLRDIDESSLIAPGAADIGATMVAATNTTQTAAGVTPQPTISQYVYQALKSDNTLCTLTTEECRKFNIYYRLEANNTVQQEISRNQ